MIFKYLTLVCFAFLLHFSAQSQVLLPFYENNKIGCVDTSGKIFIPAKFNGLGDFADGLAPARIEGHYGFINVQGEYVLPAIYDYAEPFSEGFAKVWIDGKLSIINKKGEVQKQFKKYDFVEDFKEGLAVVRSKGKCGLINKDGKEILKPVYLSISDFSEGCAVISKFTKKRNSENFSMIDKKGNFLIPFNKYFLINSFKNGYAYAWRDSSIISQNKVSKSSYECIIDVNGKELGAIKLGDSLRIDTYSGEINMNEQSIVVSFSRTDINENRIDYQIIMDNTFKIMIDNPSYKKISPIRYEKALVLFESEKLKGIISQELGIVDIKGNLLKDKYYGMSIHGNTLKSFDNNGLAIVAKNHLWGVIDTTGNFVIEPQFDEVDDKGFHNNFLIVQQSKETAEDFRNQSKIKKIEYEVDTVYTDYYSQDTEVQQFVTVHYKTHIDTITGELREKLLKKIEERNKLNDSILHAPRYKVKQPEEYYGIIHKSGKWIAKPQFSFIGQTKIPNIWFVKTDSTYGYLNDRGEYIWKNQYEKNEKLDTLDLDYKSNASYTAYSFSVSENDELEGDYEEGYNGWSRSSNMYKVIDFQAVENKLQLSVQTNQLDTSNHYIASYKVSLSNTTQDTTWLDAQDSRLYISLQAKDKKGKWITIQDYPSSWCGNSYHTLFLPPKSYWNFSCPVFKGSMKTQFRLALQAKKGKDSRKNQLIYSNTFDGRINPAQFWRINRSFSDNLMSPY